MKDDESTARRAQLRRLKALFGKEFRQRAKILHVVAGQVHEFEAQNE